MEHFVFLDHFELYKSMSTVYTIPLELSWKISFWGVFELAL